MLNERKTDSEPFYQCDYSPQSCLMHIFFPIQATLKSSQHSNILAFTLNWQSNEYTRTTVGSHRHWSGLTLASDWKLPQDQQDKLNKLARLHDYSSLILRNIAHVHLSQPIYLLALSRNTAVMCVAIKVRHWIMTKMLNEHLRSYFRSSLDQGELKDSNLWCFYFRSVYWEHAKNSSLL